ncbi:MAG: aminotransferase class V-fold PLP-dependent enzyme [Haloarculaceae archaeon]
MNPEDLRADIPALEECTYLNTGASGPSPNRVLEAVTDFHRRHKVDAPCGDGMYGVASATKEAARETVAGHLGAEAGEIALTRSTVDGINLVANAIDWEPGASVVRPDFEHPAGILPWWRLSRAVGVEERVVETSDGHLDVDDLAAAIDDSTELVCTSSLTWTSGTRVPIEEVVEIAHEAGARVLVDAVQSVGQHPVDVEAWGADFVAASGHKWLLGPWGSGMLYVAEEALESLTPARVGYFGVEETEDEVEFAPDASRFELGTTAIAPYAGLAAGIETVEAVGMDAIQARIERLTDRLTAGLGDRLLSPREFESGLVTFEASDAEATVERLEADGVVIRSLPRPNTCRVSVHAFNAAADIDRLLDGL